MAKNSITGIVKPHKGNGRKFGYPTANIDVSTDVEEGVYAGFTTIKFTKLKYENMPSFIFVGRAETLGETDLRLESHIFDVEDKDLYGAEMTVQLIEKIRDNKRYDSIDELLEQMHKDEIQVRQILSNYSD